MLKHLGIIIMLISVSGCAGFKLRGSHVIPSYLKTVYITPNDPYTPLQRSVRSLLSKNRIIILCDTISGVSTLNLSNPVITQQALAYGPSGQLQRYRLNLCFSYTLTTKDFTKSGTITRGRELSQSPNLILSNESEEQIVKEELLEEAVYELLRQITSRPSSNSKISSSGVNNPC